MGNNGIDVSAFAFHGKVFSLVLSHYLGDEGGTRSR